MVILFALLFLILSSSWLYVSDTYGAGSDPYFHEYRGSDVSN